MSQDPELNRDDLPEVSAGQWLIDRMGDSTHVSVRVLSAVGVVSYAYLLGAQERVFGLDDEETPPVKDRIRFAIEAGTIRLEDTFHKLREKSSRGVGL